MTHHQPNLDTSPKVSDEVRKTTCYMCACRCGINVHMKGSKVAYIEGNKDHPVNQGVLCAKGSAGIMQHNAPSRLRAPMKRVGPRGSGEFEEISWDEALDMAVGLLKPIRENDPEKLAFFTGRDQSQSFTGLWAQSYGTPNFAAHGGFCSVNMAAAGIYTMGGAFWEFGQPDWDLTKMVMIFGVAEDHDSNPIKMGIGRAKAKGAKIIGVNPIRTGYNAVADEWVGITPGTDGLYILSMIHCLMKAGKIDLDYLARFTNASVLVNEDPASDERGLLLKDSDGQPQVIDRNTGKLAPWNGPTTSAKWPQSWPASRLMRKSASTGSGQISAGRPTRKWSAALSLFTRCAASLPIPTGFKPVAPCTRCKSSSARSKHRAACGSSRPTPSRPPHTPSHTARSHPARR